MVVQALQKLYEAELQAELRVLATMRAFGRSPRQYVPKGLTGQQGGLGAEVLFHAGLLERQGLVPGLDARQGVYI